MDLKKKRITWLLVKKGLFRKLEKIQRHFFCVSMVTSRSLGGEKNLYTPAIPISYNTCIDSCIQVKYDIPLPTGSRAG